MKNQFSDLYFSKHGWLYLQFTGDTPGFSNVSPTITKKVVQKWSNLQKRCGMSWNEWKINFPNFYFLSCSWFCTQNWTKNWRILSTKTNISQKLKIGKLIFHSLKHIPHLSCKYDHFWNCEKMLSTNFIHLAQKKIQLGVSP